MGVLFLDSAERLLDYILKWPEAISGTSAIISGIGRTGKGYTLGSNRGFGVGIGNQATLAMGFAFKSAEVPYVIDTNKWLALASFRDQSQTSDQLILWTGPACAMRVCRGSDPDANVLGTSEIGVYNPGAYHYIEFKATINAAGSFEVRVDGINVLSAAGVNTQTSVNAYADQAWVCRKALGSSHDGVLYCDIYVATDFLNDVVVESLTASGAGDSTALAAVGSAANYQCIDEDTPNYDTDLVSGVNAGDKDLYELGALVTSSGAVKAVQVGLLARKCDGSARSIRALLKSNGAEDQGADKTLADLPAHHLTIWDLDPDGDIAWLIAAVNALQAGVEVRS